MSRTWKDTKAERERVYDLIGFHKTWCHASTIWPRFCKRALSKARRRAAKFGERHSSLRSWESTCNWRGW